MKAIRQKIARGMKRVFGWGITLTLFAGGLTFFGYLAAILIGGTTAAWLCTFLYKQVVPVMIYVTTAMILLGLLAMYFFGETALTPEQKQEQKEENG